MARTWFVSVLVISIVIFVSQTLGEPQSEHDRLEKNLAEDFSDSQTHTEYTEHERQGSHLRNASTSSSAIISRSRRSDPITSECYYTISPGVGEVYRFHNIAATWADARRICQREDGHLAVINSLEESRRIASLIDNANPHIGSDDTNYVLIGFHNYLSPRSDFGHRTIDGRTLEQAGFAEWATGEPSSVGNLLGNEDCGSVLRDGKLNDISCDRKYAFICELAPFNDVSPVGPAGPQGIPGIKGDTGIQGPVGVAGEKGEPGKRGTDGLQGVAGEKGTKGDTGCIGSIGPKGNKGEKGEGPPGFPGPVGPRGPRGPRGSKGDAGSPGPTGSKGEKGNSGRKGRDGPRGAVGEKGSKGDTGTSGPVGFTGEKGDRGSEGPQGLPGLVGPKGSRGQTGVQGIAGSPGPAGLNGRKGEPGEKGTDGLQGVKGDKGSQGDAGPPGPQGFTGLTGPTGNRGPLGPSGPRGEPGLGFDAVCLAVLASMEYSRGYGSIARPEASIFSENDTPQEMCREFIVRAYEQISAPAPSQYFVQPRDGSKESPARTCKDLFNAYPDKPNGFYWVDPNGGDVTDAISVICYAKNSRTCIRPSKTSREDPMSHISDQREVWLSELKNETQITYTADANQINALQLLSSHAEQGLIYHCLKSVGYYDAEAQTYDRGLKLLAWNDFELVPISGRDLDYELISDGCRDRPDKWNKTVIMYRTGEPARLPILDVRMMDVGKGDERFIVEILDVCFE